MLFPIAHFAAVDSWEASSGQLPGSREIGKVAARTHVTGFRCVNRDFQGPKLQICPVLPFMRRRPGSVQNCIDSRLRVIAFCQHEEERTHARTSMLRPLSYVWCRRRGGL
jgi:hypothetical protein